MLYVRECAQFAFRPVAKVERLDVQHPSSVDVKVKSVLGRFGIVATCDKP